MTLEKDVEGGANLTGMLDAVVNGTAHQKTPKNNLWRVNRN